MQPRAPQALLEKMVEEAISLPDIGLSSLDLLWRKHLSGTPYRFPRIPEILEAAARLNPPAERMKLFRTHLRCKAVRTDSGVAPITLLTKPYPCPGKCVYCPTEARMPKSYIPSEPAAARALSLRFDPYKQVTERVKALERNGHEAKKIELIIKGGTWSSYPWDYRKWFIKRVFDAANHLGHRAWSGERGAGTQKRKRFYTLKESQDANETAEYRVIGLTIETRPDWVNPSEIIRLRELGVTRVELGIQALDDEILKLTQRGHTIEHAVRATILLKAAAFKTDYHFMPGQPGSDAQKDVAMYRQMFADERFRPDMVKLYPCVVLPTAELQAWYDDGRFKPLVGEELIETMVQIQSLTPYYCRVPRLIRDFPSPEISGGNTVTNLRQEVERRMEERGIEQKDLRVREAGHRPPLGASVVAKLFIEEYENVGGKELFLSYENPERTTVLAFLRLRFPNHNAKFDDEKTDRWLHDIRASFPELIGSAYVRELHTYGQALALGEEKDDAVQHKGLGRKLMEEAERIAIEKGYASICVISGIGVRAYYRMLGYQLAGTYMKKNLV